MPRACVIVLDAVGAGELPGRRRVRRRGLRHARQRRAGGRRARPARTSRRSASATSSRSRAARRSPARPPSPAGCVERSKGKDTTTGHWELMGIVTPQALPTYPHGFPHEVIDPFMHATGRGVLGNKPASGTEIIQELGEEHQRRASGSSTRPPTRSSRSPRTRRRSRSRSSTTAAEIAREILTGKHAVGRVIARPFDRRAGQLRAHAEPARLLARADARRTT